MIHLFPLHKIIRWYSNCFKIACFSSYRAVWSVKYVWPTSFVTHECSRHHITISSPVDKIVANFSHFVSVVFVINFRTLCNKFLSSIYVKLVKLPPISYIIFTCCENIVEVFESLTTSFWTMDTPLFSGYLRAFDTLWHLMLSLQ
jgi:hypothetical protein